MTRYSYHCEAYTKGMRDKAYGAAFQPASACSDTCQGRTVKSLEQCQPIIMQPQHVWGYAKTANLYLMG